MWIAIVFKYQTAGAVPAGIGSALGQRWKMLPGTGECGEYATPPIPLRLLVSGVAHYQIEDVVWIAVHVEDDNIEPIFYSPGQFVEIGGEGSASTSMHLSS